MADANVKVHIGAEDDASQKLKGIGKQIDAMSGKFKKAGTVMLGIGAALGGGMLALTDKWADAGDEVAKMAKRTGWAVESLSELRHAAELSGTNLEAVEKGSRRLSRAIIDATEGGTTYAEALARVGLNAQDLIGIPIEEQFWRVSEAIANTTDETIKVATAAELFGRSGTELLPMLSDGAEGLNNMRQEAHDLGVVFDEDTAKAAEEFKDSMTRLKTSLAGVGAQIAESLAPEITKFVDSATEAIEKIKTWIDANPELVTGLKLLVGVLIGGGGVLIALSQISRAIIAINAALVIMHALSGPAGWAKLAAGLAIAAGAIIGINKLMGGQGTTEVPRPPGPPAPPPPGVTYTPTAASVPMAMPGNMIPAEQTVNVNVEGTIISEENLIDKLRTEFVNIKERNTTTGF